MIGPRPNLLGHDAGTHKRLEVDQPILTNADLAKIRSVEEVAGWRFPYRNDQHHMGCAMTGNEGLELAMKEMCWAATEAVLADKNILILSDRAQGSDRDCHASVAGNSRRAPSSRPAGPADADRAGDRNW